MPESFTSLITGSFSLAATAYEISVCAASVSSIKLSLTLQYFVGEYCKVGEGYVKAMERFSLFNNTPKLLIETPAALKAQAEYQ